MNIELQNYIEAEKKKKREYMKSWCDKNREKVRKYNRIRMRKFKNIPKRKWRV